MSSLIERLRALNLPVTPGSALPPAADSRRTTDRPGAGAWSEEAADALGGEWIERRGQRFLLVERKYAPGHRHGHVAVCDAAPGGEGWKQLHVLAGCGDPFTASGRRLLFLDLETTGLAGGAGTYAFLVGCGWFDAGTFRVRQYFLSDFAAERLLLESLAELAVDASAIVTYNGKTFDLPVIETRYLLHRLPTPFSDIAHLDMLHPARRLWRPAEAAAEGGANCRLTSLERTLCGHTREGDVPGFEIPARYFHFVRSGDARPLEGVLEHNRLDLLSLALCTAHAVRLVEEGPAVASDAREAYGVGRLYERAGLALLAAASYRHAASGLPADDQLKAEALRAQAVLARRERRYGEAAEAWRALLALGACPPPLAREAMEALAVHHEHRVRDLEAARRFALQSLRVPATSSRMRAGEHRLARLNRKLGVGDAPGALF